MPEDLANQFRQLGPTEHAAVVRFAAAIHVLQALYDRLTVAQAGTFLSVWAEEGLTVSTLALRCGVTPATISHHLRALSARHLRGTDGLDLLVVCDEHRHIDMRLRYVHLTERGAALAARMVEVMDGHHRQRIAPLVFLDEPEELPED